MEHSIIYLIRRDCHKIIDKYWETTTERNTVYLFMSDWLGKTDVHIADCNFEYCQMLIDPSFEKALKKHLKQLENAAKHHKENGIFRVKRKHKRKRIKRW